MDDLLLSFYSYLKFSVKIDIIQITGSFYLETFKEIT